MKDSLYDPTIATKTVAMIVIEKEMYLGRPSHWHFRAVLDELLKRIYANRVVEMAALEGYSKLLRNIGHNVTIFISTGPEKKEIRVKAALNIF